MALAASAAAGGTITHSCPWTRKEVLTIKHMGKGGRSAARVVPSRAGGGPGRDAGDGRVRRRVITGSRFCCFAVCTYLSMHQDTSRHCLESHLCHCCPRVAAGCKAKPSPAKVRRRWDTAHRVCNGLLMVRGRVDDCAESRQAGATSACRASSCLRSDSGVRCSYTR